MNQVENIKGVARHLRKRIIEIAMSSDFHSHYGSSLSSADIVATLFSSILKYDVERPDWPDRDRFFLSKGHCVLILYSVLEHFGFIPKGVLENSYQKDFSKFGSHPVADVNRGIEISSGSLGHGLGMAIGSLLAARQHKRNYRAFVLLGNGECNEGSVWEAAMLASQCRLENLIAIVDNNHDQGDGPSGEILDMEPIVEKWKAFGWNAILVNGHIVEELLSVFTGLPKNGRPTVVIAETIKGKGVSFMEGRHEWHHNKTTQEQFEMAIKEIDNL